MRPQSVDLFEHPFIVTLVRPDGHPDRHAATHIAHDERHITQHKIQRSHPLIGNPKIIQQFGSGTRPSNFPSKYFTAICTHQNIASRFGHSTHPGAPFDVSGQIVQTNSCFATTQKTPLFFGNPQNELPGIRNTKHCTTGFPIVPKYEMLKSLIG